MFRHRIGSKDPFQNLLDCGANLFPEMDSLQLTALTREVALFSLWLFNNC